MNEDQHLNQNINRASLIELDLKVLHCDMIGQFVKITLTSTNSLNMLSGHFGLFISQKRKNATFLLLKNHLLYPNLTTRCQKVEKIVRQTNSIY